jgi:adenosylhomocysteine nucleosidase
MGPANAYAAAGRLIAAGVGALASVGLCGGLDPNLRSGHIIIARRILQLKANNRVKPWQTDPAASDKIYRLLQTSGQTTYLGDLITTPEAVFTTDGKTALFDQTHAIAIDMESAAVARAAHENKLPFFSLRAVCDTAKSSVPPESTAFVDGAGNIRKIIVLKHIFRKPSLIVALLHMGRCFSVAHQALKQAWQTMATQNLPARIRPTSSNGAHYPNF